MNTTLFIIAILFFGTGVTTIVINITQVASKKWISVMSLLSLIFCFGFSLFIFQNKNLGQPIPVEQLADNGKFYQAITEPDTLSKTKNGFLCYLPIKEYGKDEIFFIVYDSSKIFNYKKIKKGTCFFIEKPIQNCWFRTFAPN